MGKKLLLFIFTTLAMISLYGQSDNYAEKRNRIFVLEQSEYLTDMYKYLVCILATGDKGNGHVNTVTDHCKKTETQNAVLSETKPTEQMVYSSLKPYGYAIQTMILCLAEGGARNRRGTTLQVIDYCDKVVQPLD